MLSAAGLGMQSGIGSAGRVVRGRRLSRIRAGGGCARLPRGSGCFCCKHRVFWHPGFLAGSIIASNRLMIIYWFLMPSNVNIWLTQRTCCSHNETSPSVWRWVYALYELEGGKWWVVLINSPEGRDS